MTAKTATAKKAAPKTFAGYKPSAVANFSPMRDGERAKVLRLMDGTKTIAAIAKRLDKSEALVRAHVYLMHTVHGIGCRLDGGKITATFPGAKTAAEAVRAKAGAAPKKERTKRSRKRARRQGQGANG